MNPANPHNPDGLPTDPALDEIEALLDAEAAHDRAAPAELEAKVLALTDPGLLSLLDEALAPEQAPDRLAERIIAATATGPGAHPAPVAQPRNAVLARIEPTGWRYAVAAAIVLAAGAGLWWAGQHAPVDHSAPDIALLPPVWEDQDETQELFAEATVELDSALDTVGERIDAYAANDDSIWADMDGYEDFLLALDPQT